LNEGGIMVAQNGVSFMQLQESVDTNTRLRKLYKVSDLLISLCVCYMCVQTLAYFVLLPLAIRCFFL
jgi:hypothetical protein